MPTLPALCITGKLHSHCLCRVFWWHISNLTAVTLETNFPEMDTNVISIQIQPNVNPDCTNPDCWRRPDGQYVPDYLRIYIPWLTKDFEMDLMSRSSDPTNNFTDFGSFLLLGQNIKANCCVDREYPFYWDTHGTKQVFPHPMEINGTMRKQPNLYHQQTQTILRNVVTPTICAFGFLGNLLNIIVLSWLRLLRPGGARDNGTHLGLIVLAVSDMLFCLSMFPRFLVSESSSIFDEKDFRWFYQVQNSIILRTIGEKWDMNTI